MFVHRITDLRPRASGAIHENSIRTQGPSLHFAGQQIWITDKNEDKQVWCSIPGLARSVSVQPFLRKELGEESPRSPAYIFFQKTLAGKNPERGSLPRAQSK